MSKFIISLRIWCIHPRTDRDVIRFRCLIYSEWQFLPMDLFHLQPSVKAIDDVFDHLATHIDTLKASSFLFNLYRLHLISRRSTIYRLARQPFLFLRCLIRWGSYHFWDENSFIIILK